MRRRFQRLRICKKYQEKVWLIFFYFSKDRYLQIHKFKLQIYTLYIISHRVATEEKSVKIVEFDFGKFEDGFAVEFAFIFPG